MALQRISESVYVGLCLKIGTSQQVAIRRDFVDIRELIEHKIARTEKNETHVMLSGSRREGFRLEDSDMDFMIWPIHFPVLWDFSQAQFYNTQRDILILCDSTDSPPGFTLLWLPLEMADSELLSACVILNEALYISSAKHRNCSAALPGSTVHGPCSSGSRVGLMDYDFAFCFVSDFWPPSASSWIDRCHSWPLPCIVDDIIRSGCHFVPIGHKHGIHINNEWRISFSLAEQKLVYSMNHTQFLTYGLLKLFVKDFNNGLSEEEKLLCSYHMKTTIFWVIQQNTTLDWNPQNLLGGFWICFKLLLKWVYEGVCPNFFIPENNMFLNKVHGNAQRNLFTRLYGLYEKGVSFLLQCPSISFYLMDIICNPRLYLCTNDHSLISDVMIEFDQLFEMSCNDILFTENLPNCMKYLHTAEHLIHSYLTQYHTIMLQKHTATILQTCAFSLHETCTNTSGVNRHMYIADKISCYMLKFAAKFGFISDLLFLAMYHYKKLRYRAALSVIETTKVNLEHTRKMFEGHEDPERYTEVVGGHSLSWKTRQLVPFYINFQSSVCFINELALEQQSALQNKQSILCIPPFILLHMLKFFCCRHVDLTEAQRALYDLQDLVHNDQGLLIPVQLRDISWDILGICQELAGDYQAALFSYQRH